MSNSVQLPNEDFEFSNLTLANPQGLQGGAYFSKLKRVGEFRDLRVRLEPNLGQN